MKAFLLLATVLVSIFAIACTSSEPTSTPTPAALHTPTSIPPASPPMQSQGFHIPPIMTGTIADGKTTYDLVMQPGDRVLTWKTDGHAGVQRELPWPDSGHGQR